MSQCNCLMWISQCNWLIHMLPSGLFQPGLKEKRMVQTGSGYARLEYTEHFSSALHSQRCNRKVTLESSWVTLTVWGNLWIPWHGANAEVPNKTSTDLQARKCMWRVRRHTPSRIDCFLSGSAPQKHSLCACCHGAGTLLKRADDTREACTTSCADVPWHVSTCGICQVNEGCSWNGFLDQICVLLNAWCLNLPSPVHSSISYWRAVKCIMM